MYYKIADCFVKYEPNYMYMQKKIKPYEERFHGESTGQLGLMMEKVSEHYQALHKSAVAQLKSMIEPIMIIVLAGIVGVLLLSIITPMFDIYNQIG